MTDTNAPGAFPANDRNRARRLYDRARYDREAVFAIVDSTPLCHVAYVINGQPFCTPTSHWRDGDTLFWHGSSASRMLKHLRAGAPACLTVSHLDGLVFARSAFHHSVNYRSALCFGQARLVIEPAEKRAALDGLLEKLWPGRSGEARPPTSKELKATAVVRMTIEDATAKSRSHGVVDDAEDLGVGVWAGVVPVTSRLGEAAACPLTPPGSAAVAPEAAFPPGATLEMALLGRTA